VAFKEKTVIGKKKKNSLGKEKKEALILIEFSPNFF
jgi:hypothetical protein